MILRTQNILLLYDFYMLPTNYILFITCTAFRTTKEFVTIVFHGYSETIKLLSALRNSSILKNGITEP